MSDYTKIVDYSVKDALASGDPSKLILGAQIDAEFNAIATAIATKANTASVVGGALTRKYNTVATVTVSNTVTETALNSPTVAAGTLTAAGDVLEYRLAGHLTNTVGVSETTTFKFKVNGVQYSSAVIPCTSGQAEGWEIRARLFYKSAGNVLALIDFMGALDSASAAAPVLAPTRVLTTLDWTSTITLSVTATNSVADTLYSTLLYAATIDKIAGV